MADQFTKAVYMVREGPKRDSSNDTKLKFYALYKQATQGDVKGDQPWAVQVEARAKWDAWNAQKGKSSEDAKAEYVKLVAEGDANWEESETVKNMPAGWTIPKQAHRGGLKGLGPLPTVPGTSRMARGRQPWVPPAGTRA